MKFFPCCWLLLLCFLAACQGGDATAPPEPPPSASKPAGKPQPKLATIKLWLGPQEIVAEQAVTLDQVRTGMMFRKEMAEHEGMLFIFGEPERISFYMRNTLIPLSCAYIDPDGTILEIHDMKPLDETPIESRSDRVQYVLEMKQGWFERNQVRPAMLVRAEQGSLHETYFAP